MSCIMALSCSKKKSRVINTEAEMLNFTVAGKFYSIKDSSVSYTYSSYTDVTQLSPTIVVSENATIEPLPNIKQDFTKPVIYTITSEDGKTKTKYTVKVIVKGKKPVETKPEEKAKEDGPAITSFKFNNELATISENAIVHIFTGLEDLEDLTPVITLKQGYTISPASGVKQDFTKPVFYTVTDSKGTETIYIPIISTISPVAMTSTGAIKLNNPTETKAGEKIQVQGKEYTVVDNNSIKNLSNSEFPTAITTKVTQMLNLFRGNNTFNGDLSTWDMSNVLSTEGMFQGATNFNKPIGNWKFTKVRSMDRMFNDAQAFNQDLSGWCVDKVGSKPTDFDRGATAWQKSKPRWGSCP